MAANAKHPLIRYVHRAALAQGEQVSHGQLLEQFLQQRDEQAFAVLVQRFGPMVLGVCRRVLGHAQDAEDAFQATFLVLARKAASVSPRDKVGHWLYGVACRTALAARTARARRRVKEAQAPPRTESSGADAQQELRSELDRQLNGLPEKYRLPVLLCDLQGQTQQEAARRLGWPEGTVSGRLFRARQLLATRLKKQGIAVSVAALSALLSQQAVAAVPGTLATATAKAGGAWLNPSALTSTVISSQVIQLAEGVLRAMFMKRMRTVLSALVLTGLLLTVAGTLTMHLLANQPADPPVQGNQGADANQPNANQTAPKKVQNAKETFEQMEAKLKQAKTLRCLFDISLEAAGKRIAMKGRVLVGGPKKMVLEMEGDVTGDGKKKLTIISDGNQQVVIADGRKEPARPAQELDQHMAVSLARSGIALPIFTVSPQPANAPAQPPAADNLYQVSDFKLGKPEAVGNKQATVLTYQLKCMDQDEPFQVTTWIDRATSLPLKRVLTPSGKSDIATITETYTECSVNVILNPGEFLIPK